MWGHSSIKNFRTPEQQQIYIRYTGQMEQTCAAHVSIAQRLGQGAQVRVLRLHLGTLEYNHKKHLIHDHRSISPSVLFGGGTLSITHQQILVEYHLDIQNPELINLKISICKPQTNRVELVHKVQRIASSKPTLRTIWKIHYGYTHKMCISTVFQNF